ncbi:MAG: exo-alpha-sialidase [Armatimonadetes bacterium]|nr:exo-alpha-sialidase [Armatimonadota bacterium]
MSQTPIGETAHFWYRPGPEGLYVDSQRDNRAFARAPGRILLSEDNGLTWPHSLAFADAPNVTFSCILGNGNLIFATRERLYLSTDNLRTCEPITVKGLDGSDYLPHTPRNPDCPGWYFHTIPGVNTFDVRGTEMLIWGNYCNVIGGAAPVNIYYSTDGGQTVKIAYSFGQSPYTRDDGSPGGGTEGTPLGDPDNPLCCRHIHTVTYNPAEDAFYTCTGDHDKPEGFECHWLRGTYDWTTDRWEWRLLVSDRLNSRYKAGGISFVDGQLYWISDSNGPEPYDRGIFRCGPADLTRPEAHTLLFNPEVESGNMIIQDSVFLASHCAPASPLDTGIIISTDAGETWAQYDLKEFGKRSPTRLHPKNSEGWFRMDLRSGWVDYADVLFLKPKEA